MERANLVGGMCCETLAQVLLVIKTRFGKAFFVVVRTVAN